MTTLADFILGLKFKLYQSKGGVQRTERTKRGTPPPSEKSKKEHLSLQEDVDGTTKGGVVGGGGLGGGVSMGEGVCVLCVGVGGEVCGGGFWILL